MKVNFLLTINNGKAGIEFSDNADELIEKYKNSDLECQLFIRPTATKKKKAGNAKAVKPQSLPKKAK
jgi:hypothetical protein